MKSAKEMSVTELTAEMCGADMRAEVRRLITAWGVQAAFERQRPGSTAIDRIRLDFEAAEDIIATIEGKAPKTDKVIRLVRVS
jgi:hypothetical protein